MVDDQNDGCVKEDSIDKAADAVTQHEQAMFGCRARAQTEKMPTPPLLEVLAGAGHQIFDADDVGQDVIAVVADEWIAVDENG